MRIKNRYIPEFMSKEVFRGYFSANKLGELFSVDKMSASSWVAKMNREETPVPHTLYNGVKKYKVAHVIAKAMGKGCKINGPKTIEYKRDQIAQHIDHLNDQRKLLEDRIQSLSEQIEKAELVKTAQGYFDHPIASEYELVNAASSDIPKSGIYFLIRGESVVYVGQSISVLNRIGGHIAEGQKRFNKYCYIECDKKSLDTLESLYIYLFRPQYNGIHKSGDKRAPLGKGELLTLIDSIGKMKSITNENIENYARVKANEMTGGRYEATING